MPPDYNQQPQPPDQSPGYPPQQPLPHPAAYDFIINPDKPSSSPTSFPKLPGANSMLLRACYTLVGLLVLLILFIIIKGLIVGKPKLDSFVTVAQDQQELIHLASKAATNSQNQGLSDGNQNLSATITLSLGSNQEQITKYLTNNDFTASTNTLSLKENPSLDTQLTNAQAAGTYNQVFQDIMVSQLTGYSNDLRLAYKDAGQKGRTLLSSDYNQAQLLIKEASSPANLATN